MMFVDHYRERKTGPCFPVAVVGRRVHGGRRYTLYPPGHYPYGRVSYAPYSTAGQVLVDAESGQPQWEATLFEAALDAEREERWPSEQQWWQRLEVPRRRTQGRRLELAGRLTGVHPQLAEEVRERIATRLGVATMVLIRRRPRLGPVVAHAGVGGGGGAACPCRRRLDAGPLGGSWGGQRPVGAAAPATGGALGGGRRRLGAGAGPWFRRPGTAVWRGCPQAPSAAHDSGPSGRLRRRYGGRTAVCEGLRTGP